VDVVEFEDFLYIDGKERVSVGWGLNERRDAAGADEFGVTFFESVE
jgi:hypothetical protein